MYVHRYVAGYIPQQNYLTKMDLDGSVFLHKILSLCYVCPGRGDI